MTSGSSVGSIPLGGLDAPGGILHHALALLRQYTIPVILTILAVQATYRLWFHPLSRVPGPLLARVSGLWRTGKYFQSTWFEDIVQLHKTYGPVVRIAPNEVSFVDEQAMREVYGHGKPNQKTVWYDTWNLSPVEGIFPTRNPRTHRFLRGRVSAMYSMSAVMSSEPLISETLALSLRQLHCHARRGEPIKLDRWVEYFTFDLVGQLGLGAMKGFLQQEEDLDGIIQGIVGSFYLAANLGHVWGQTRWLTTKFTESVMTLLGVKAQQVLRHWIESSVRERQRVGKTGRPDMLQFLVDLRDASGKPLSFDEIGSEIGALLGAGADTTGIGILACLEQLLRHPDGYRRLQREVDEAHARLTYAPAQELDYREVEKLPYLSAVIKEATRLHPSIVYQLPRKPPPSGLQIGEYFIAPSADVGISPAAMNRSQEIFGLDADHYRPERWMFDEADDAARHRVKSMEARLTTFGMGSRSCIGKNIALVEIYKYIASFVRNFDAELVDREQRWKVRSYWLAKLEDCWVRLQSRDQVRSGAS